MLRGGSLNIGLRAVAGKERSTDTAHTMTSPFRERILTGRDRPTQQLSYGGPVTLGAEATNFTWLIQRVRSNNFGVCACDRRLLRRSSPRYVCDVPSGTRRPAPQPSHRSCTARQVALPGVSTLGKSVKRSSKWIKASLIIMAISDGSSWAVLLPSRSCDIGLVGYEMALLVSRTGDLLTPDPRARSGRVVLLR